MMGGWGAISLFLKSLYQHKGILNKSFYRELREKGEKIMLFAVQDFGTGCHPDYNYLDELSNSTTSNVPKGGNPVPVGGNNQTPVGDSFGGDKPSSTPAEAPQQQTPAQTGEPTPEQKAANERLENAKKAQKEAFEKTQKHRTTMKQQLDLAKEQKVKVTEALTKLNEANGKLGQLDPKDPKSFKKAQKYLKEYDKLKGNAKQQANAYQKLVKNYYDAASRYNSAINKFKTARVAYNEAMKASITELKAARNAVAGANKAAQPSTPKPKGNFWSRLGKGFAKCVPNTPLKIAMAVLTTGAIVGGVLLLTDDEKTDEQMNKTKTSSDVPEKQEVVIEGQQEVVSQEVSTSNAQVVAPNTTTAQQNVAQSEQQNQQVNISVVSEDPESVAAEDQAINTEQVLQEAQQTEEAVRQAEAEFTKTVSKGGNMWNIVKEYLKNQNNAEPTDMQIANTLNQLMNDGDIEITSSTNDVRTAVWAGRNRDQIYIHPGETVKIKQKDQAAA